MTQHTPTSNDRPRQVGLLLGPLLAAALLVAPAPAELDAAAWRTAALGVWMAIWWATEAIPVPTTALLPVVLFPLLGIAGIRDVTAPYAHPTIFLFLGGFMVALAVQRAGLHRRIALSIVANASGSGATLVAGFMIASAVLSMWVTNTATTMMLLPIASSVVVVVQRNLPPAPDIEERFPVALLLGIAYGATIGGTATLIGTPPNALLAAFMEEHYQVEIGFAQWTLVGLPFVVILLPVAWWVLVRRVYPLQFSTGGPTREHLRQLLGKLGGLGVAERRVGIVFVCLALAWMSRPLLVQLPALQGLTDTGIALAAALSLFLIPSGTPAKTRLLRWRDCAELPWGILLLFGGGLTLAAAVSNTGLAAWMGGKLSGLGLSGSVLLVVVIAVLIIFLTELTSNTATTATFLPVVAAIAAESGAPPISLTAPVALAASCAFMLPVATPPNAIVFSSGMLSIPQMVRAGFWINLLGAALVSLVAILLAPRVL